MADKNTQNKIENKEEENEEENKEQKKEEKVNVKPPSLSSQQNIKPHSAYGASRGVSHHCIDYRNDPMTKEKKPKKQMDWKPCRYIKAVGSCPVYKFRKIACFFNHKFSGYEKCKPPEGEYKLRFGNYKRVTYVYCLRCNDWYDDPNWCKCDAYGVEWRGGK